MEDTNETPPRAQRSSQRLSPAVYRRRRLVVFLACGLLLIGVVKVFSNLTGGGSSGHVETSVAQAGRASPMPATASAAATPISGAAPAPSLSGVPPCSLAALSVRAGIPNYQLRKPFVLPVTVQLANRLGAGCQLDTSRLAVVVQNGTTQAWSSQGCTAGATAAPGTALVVPAGSTVDWTVRWPAKACTGPLFAGQYDVSARLDGGVLTGWAGTVTVS